MKITKSTCASILAFATLAAPVNANVLYSDGGFHAGENTSQAGTGDLSYSAGDIVIDADGSDNGYKSGNTGVFQMSEPGGSNVGSSAATSFYGRFLWLPGPASPTSFINFSSIVSAGRLTFSHSGGAQVRLFDVAGIRVGTLAPPSLAVGETNLIVFRVDAADLARTGEETVKIWYNPSSSADIEAGENATVSFTFDLFDEVNDGFGGFQSILPQDSGVATPQLDNIVFAESAADLWSSPEAFSLTITPSGSNPGNYNFEWNSKPGMVYDLVSAVVLSTPPSDWEIWNGNSKIPSGGATTSLSEVPGGGDQARFFSVVEKTPQPLLSEDFEAGNGGFTVVDKSADETGADWAYGTPDSSGPGGAVSAGNGGSSSCWGTNLGAFAGGAGDPGFYTDPTDTCLRSPVIDLTGVPAAVLSFAHALDLDAGDSAKVNIIDAITDTVIAADIVSISDDNGVKADWKTVGPVTIPAAALGQAVRIEWRLSGTGGASKDFMGWYIEDVMVTRSTP